MNARGGAHTSLFACQSTLRRVEASGPQRNGIAAIAAFDDCSVRSRAIARNHDIRGVAEAQNLMAIASESAALAACELLYPAVRGGLERKHAHVGSAEAMAIHLDGKPSGLVRLK